MDWHESIASGVPEDPTPGREGLRGEIIDELDDHLSCAMQRELRRTDDEAEARKAVLERFGDPRKVAWQLWWDAVKEKVMRDRIMLSAVALITLASLVVSVAALRAVQQGQQVNQAVLAKLAELPQSAAPPTPELTGDWSMAVIRAVSDGDAQPMEGIAVQLRGHIFNASDIGELTEKTDKNGVAKIGPIKAGQYEFKAWANGHYAEYQNFAFFPGRTKEFTIVAPHPDRPTARVAFQVISPDKLDTSDLVLQVYLSRADTVTLGSWRWIVQGGRERFIKLDGDFLNVSRDNSSKRVTLNLKDDAKELGQLPPGEYRIQYWELFVMVPDDQDERLHRLISVYKASFGSSYVDFRAVSGEEARVQLDLAKIDYRSSVRRSTLQELKDDAIKALAESHKSEPSPIMKLKSPGPIP